MSGDKKADEKVERDRLYKQYLSSSETAKYCCVKCNFRCGEGDVYQNPCKMGCEDSGPQKEFCESNPEKRYHQ